MITAIVERHFQLEKVEDIARLLIELRRRMAKQSGYISGETLWAVNDPSLWVDVSTWTYSDQWKKWEAAPECREVQTEISNLLVTPPRVSIFKIVR
jgi:heme-degrading monooxygenase HmoA